MNNLEYDHIPIPINRDTDEIIRKSKIKLDQVYYRISHKKGTRNKIAKDLFYLLMKPLYIMMKPSVLNALKEKAKEPIEIERKYYELMPLTDKSIIVDEKCKGCGICAKVCPVKNITIVDKKPEFQHHCEMCFACDEWCPNNAIHIGAGLTALSIIIRKSISSTCCNINNFSLH
jgi:ferredoxin